MSASQALRTLTSKLPAPLRFSRSGWSHSYCCLLMFICWQFCAMLIKYSLSRVIICFLCSPWFRIARGMQQRAVESCSFRSEALYHQTLSVMSIRPIFKILDFRGFNSSRMCNRSVVFHTPVRRQTSLPCFTLGNASERASFSGRLRRRPQTTSGTSYIYIYIYI